MKSLEIQEKQGTLKVRVLFQALLQLLLINDNPDLLLRRCIAHMIHLFIQDAEDLTTFSSRGVNGEEPCQVEK